jgi:hypothetical protein
VAVKSLVGVSTRARTPPRRAGLVFLIIAAAIGLAAAVGRDLDAGFFALLPACLGLAALVNWDTRFRLDVTANGLRDGDGRTILFTNLREVRALVPASSPRGHEFPIEIVHAGGALIVPRHITAPSEDLHAFLRERLSARPPTLPPALAAFASEQKAAFGPEKVWSWGRRAGSPRSLNTALRTWWIGGAAAGAIWTAATWLTPRVSGSWRWIGSLTLFLSGLVFLVDAIQRRGTGAVTPVAGLVIGPSALALQLGDLQGQLTWQEIQAVAYPAKTGFLAGSAIPNSIALDVAGARILITDSFTHPLGEIHERIVRYWRSPV